MIPTQFATLRSVHSRITRWNALFIPPSDLLPSLPSELSHDRI